MIGAMRYPILLIAIAACGGKAAPAAPAAPVVPAPAPAPDPAPPPPPAAPKLDEAKLKAMSHAFFDAMDQEKPADLRAMLAPGMTWFQQERFATGDELVAIIQRRVEHKSPTRTRDWHEEHAFIGTNSATFVGEGVEHLPPSGKHEGEDIEGWDTLMWVPDGAGGWKVSFSQWQQGGLEAERAFWDENYRSAVMFKKTANQLLIDTVKGRKPGLALDLACGQGRNALYLAEHGWKVTGVDISGVGLYELANAALHKKLLVETVDSDLKKYDLGKDKWDLVTMIYAGDDDAQIERIKPSLKKHGLFVLEYFYRAANEPKNRPGGFTDGEIAALFKDGGWKIVKDEVVEDVADWSLQKTKLVRFVAEKQ